MESKKKITIGITTLLSVGLILGITLPLVLNKKTGVSPFLENAKTSMGGHHSSTLTKDGRLFMWGNNEYGQLGDAETNKNESLPVEVTNQFVNEEDRQIDLTNSQISMGGAHSSLLTEDGRLFMWGNNNDGQLGEGTEDDKITTPIEITDNFVDEEENVIDLTNAKIAMGGYHSSLLTEDGRLFMWGWNFVGQLGDGTKNDKSTTPIEITDNFVDEEEIEIDLTNAQILMGGNHSSLLTEDGRMFMWGFNRYGQLGNGAEDDKNLPTEITDQFIDEDENVEMIDLQGAKTSLGNNHSSLLTEDGRMFMWGSNDDGQLGDGKNNDKNRPTEITENFVDEEEIEIDLTNAQIEMGGSSLLTEDGRMFMWGNNGRGQLGDGTRNDKNSPTEITKFFDEDELDLTNAKISLGIEHSSLLTEDGRMFTWGDNFQGQLGSGSEELLENTPQNITSEFVNIVNNS